MGIDIGLILGAKACNFTVNGNAAVTWKYILWLCQYKSIRIVSHLQRRYHWTWKVETEIALKITPDAVQVIGHASLGKPFNLIPY